MRSGAKRKIIISRQVIKVFKDFFLTPRLTGKKQNMKAKSIKGKDVYKKAIQVLSLIILFIISGTIASAQTKEQMANEVWQREIQYWQLVEQDDTIAYRTLWHEDFIGYPGNDTSNKSHISYWIADFFKDKNVKYTIDIHKKAVNVVDNVVMTFYDEDDILTNTKTGTVKRETYKITHTWKKFGDTWLIIGGMDGYKK